MNQNNVIAGALAIAFVMFITLRGELPDYLKLFKPQPKAPATSDSGGGSSGGDTGSKVADAAKYAKMAADIAMMFA